MTASLIDVDVASIIKPLVRTMTQQVATLTSTTTHTTTHEMMPAPDVMEMTGRCLANICTIPYFQTKLVFDVTDHKHYLEMAQVNYYPSEAHRHDAIVDATRTLIVSYINDQLAPWGGLSKFEKVESVDAEMWYSQFLSTDNLSLMGEAPSMTKCMIRCEKVPGNDITLAWHIAINAAGMSEEIDGNSPPRVLNETGCLVVGEGTGVEADSTMIKLVSRIHMPHVNTQLTNGHVLDANPTFDCIYKKLNRILGPGINQGSPSI